MMPGTPLSAAMRTHRSGKQATYLFAWPCALCHNWVICVESRCRTGGVGAGLYGGVACGYGTGVGRSAVATGVGAVYGFPAALTSFIGRTGAVREVAGLLEEYRLVTITGPGGSGRPGWPIRWPGRWQAGSRMGHGWRN